MYRALVRRDQRRGERASMLAATLPTPSHTDYHLSAILSVGGSAQRSSLTAGTGALH